MATSLTGEEVNHWKQDFRQMDANNDGFVTYRELRKGLQSLSKVPTDAELRNLISIADLSGDGKLSLAEYLELKGVLKTFHSLDEDGDGKLSIPELVALVERLGGTVSESRMMDLTEPYDGDENGYLDMYEFAKAFPAIRKLILGDPAK